MRLYAVSKLRQKKKERNFTVESHAILWMITCMYVLVVILSPRGEVNVLDTVNEALIHKTCDSKFSFCV